MVDVQFFKAQGYAVVNDVVSHEIIDEVVEGVYSFCNMDVDRSATWYPKQTRKNGLPELNGAGMVELYHHPAMWALRQSPKIYGAFTQILHSKALWVSIDRCNFNPPKRPEDDFKGFIHWDVDTSLNPLPFALQGFVALTSCIAGGGGFQCVPKLYSDLKYWINEQPNDRNPFRPDLKGFEIVEVPVKKGDLLIWNSLLPHGTGVNRSEMPRLVQYVTMAPAQEEASDLRKWRIDAWMNRLAPEGDAFPGDPREWERNNGITAALNPLGRKLLGLDLWGGNGIEDTKIKQGNIKISKFGAPGFTP